MTRPRPLPAHLGARFTVKQALDAGLDAGRMRRADLATPFRGVRAKIRPEVDRTDLDPWKRQRVERKIRAYEYAPRLRADQFLSHESAVALWGGPLPLALIDGRPADGRTLPVHVTTLGTGPMVRAVGVHAHRDRSTTARLARPPGLTLAAPETTFVSLGHWNVIDLVALGDYFCRAWRTGYGRPDAGWTVIEVTSALFARPEELIRRIRGALAASQSAP